MATDYSIPAPPQLPGLQVAGLQPAPAPPISIERLPWAEPDEDTGLPASEVPFATPSAEVERVKKVNPPHGQGKNPNQPRRSNVTISGRVGMLMRGEIKIEDLDDEELQRGQLRDAKGDFTGRKSNMVPRAMHDEMIRRLLARGQEMYRENYLKAIKVFTDIAEDTSLDAKVRMVAAQEVVTRIAGKVPDKVELTAEVKPWEGVVREIAIATADPGDDYFHDGGTYVVPPPAE